MHKIALLIGFLAAATAPTCSAGEPMNVVLVLIDDLGHYGVTAYGADRLSEQSGAFTNVEFATPRIDALAAEGVRCTDSHAYPLCEATRVALMTGQYNSRNFVRPKALHASQITIADLFQRAGYATGVFGKWKQSRGTPETPGKDYLFELGWDEFCCFDVVDQGRRYLNPDLVINGRVVNYKKVGGVDPATGRRWYGPDICNRHALDFIDRHKSKPFFLYYPMILVHDEHTPTPDTQPASAFDRFPDTPCYQKACPGDDRRYFPDMVAYMDKLIGRVVDRLETLGLRDNTLIVVMGDNGTKEPFRHHLPGGSVYPGGKGDTKDNGTHVPLVLAGPGVSGKRGRVYEGLVDVVDVLPTLCQAAGVAIPSALRVDGVGFWSQATKGGPPHREHIYTWYNANNRWSDTAGVLRYAFNKQFKRYAGNARFPEGRFFDVHSDPLEKAGEREVTVSWGHRRRSGIPADSMNAEQRTAYRSLGEVLAAHPHVPVESVRIELSHNRIRVGEQTSLSWSVVPAYATRCNVILESSDPAVASVSKFGDIVGRSPGTTTVRAYSWDGADPQAAGKEPAFKRGAIQTSVTIRVTPAASG
ncbi:MAG: sulfatase-like hydrolase/transferase [Planctomycetota bacterium]